MGRFPLVAILTVLVFAMYGTPVLAQDTPAEGGKKTITDPVKPGATVPKKPTPEKPAPVKPVPEKRAPGKVAPISGERVEIRRKTGMVVSGIVKGDRCVTLVRSRPRKAENRDVHGTVIAMQKADVSFRLMMEVRNRIVNAYEEVMRMQV